MQHHKMRRLLAVLVNIVLLHLALSHTLLEDTLNAAVPQKDDTRDFVQLATAYGFEASGYNVTTEDGYIISLFRMRSKRCGETRGYPIILVHGLFQSADSWLDAGHNGSLAYCLVDDCRDLWVANVRGTYYGRNHTTLNPDKDRKFWEFSLDELGEYDIPAQIDFVLETTGANKVNYVGYSQGGGIFLIACISRPDYKKKINLFVGVTPATRLKHSTNILSRLVVTSLDKLKAVLPQRGDDQEYFYRGSIIQTVLADICDLRTTLGLQNQLCNSFIDLIDTAHPNSISKSTTQVLYNHFPAGVSLRQLAHYGQLMKSCHFRKYSFGKRKNRLVYGSSHTPVYDLRTVNVPTICLHGYNDGLVNTKDFDWMVRHLPNVVNVTKITAPLWNHIDMGYNKHVRYVTYPTIREYMEKYNS